MIGRRRTFVTACRLGQNADPALAGLPLSRRRCGCSGGGPGMNGLLFRLQIKQSTTVLLCRAEVRLWSNQSRLVTAGMSHFDSEANVMPIGAGIC
jgi:hypothetical protein